MIINLSRLSVLNKHVKFTATIRAASRSFADDSKKGEENTPEQLKKDNRKPSASESSKDRLNKLLASMPTKDNNILTAKKIIQQPKKISAKKNKKNEVSSDSDTDSDSKPQNILQAVKKVASLVDDKNPKQIESELLSKLLAHTDYLDDFNASPKNEKEKSDNLKDLIVGMKVDRVTKQKIGDESQSRAQFVKKTMNNRPYKERDEGGHFQRRGKDNTEYKRKRPAPTDVISSVNLYGSEPLGIFTDVQSLKFSPDILETWKFLSDRELKLAVTHPPANHFQKIALWTEQGKHWKFPIDNEQGMENEANVYFSEHVFLDQYLEGWCPTRGPIRHFMELVCVGLSKNPYVSAQDKKEHILWFQEYFENKKDLLKELIQQDTSENNVKLEK